MSCMRETSGSRRWCVLAVAVVPVLTPSLMLMLATQSVLASAADAAAFVGNNRCACCCLMVLCHHSRRRRRCCCCSSAASLCHSCFRACHHIRVQERLRHCCCWFTAPPGCLVLQLLLAELSSLPPPLCAGAVLGCSPTKVWQPHLTSITCACMHMLLQERYSAALEAAPAEAAAAPQRAVYFANRGACHLKLEQWAEAAQVRGGEEGGEIWQWAADALVIEVRRSGSPAEAGAVGGSGWAGKL